MQFLIEIIQNTIFIRNYSKRDFYSKYHNIKQNVRDI